MNVPYLRRLLFHHLEQTDLSFSLNPVFLTGGANSPLRILSSTASSWSPSSLTILSTASSMLASLLNSKLVTVQFWFLSPSPRLVLGLLVCLPYLPTILAPRTVKMLMLAFEMLIGVKMFTIQWSRF
jgi:hypothetical protein